MSNKKIQKVLSVSQAILAFFYEFGEVTVKSFFPHPYYHTFCRHAHSNSVKASFRRLTNRGLIKKKSSDTFYLTPSGRKEAFLLSMKVKSFLHHPRGQRWDGYWRMALFDIPEKKRRYRDWFRQILKNVGFVELQKSVWVRPYKIPDFLKEILWEERIKHFVRFITVKEIDFDKDLKQLFKITKFRLNPGLTSDKKSHE